MSRTVFLLPLIALLFTAALARADEPPKVGDRPPPLELEKLIQAPDGATATWEALHGKVVVLEFWATWCGGCVMAFPHLNELVDELHDQPIVFISITNEKNEPYVRKFLTKRPLKTWVALDTDGALWKAFSLKGIPRTVIVDKTGTIVGSTYPTFVTADSLREVLASKRPEWPSKYPEATEKVDPDGGPAPLLQVSYRPSTSGENVDFASSADSIVGHGLSVDLMICDAYRVPRARLLDQATDVTSQRCDLRLQLPAGNQELLHRLWQETIGPAFGLDIRREQHTTDVYVLQCRAGQPPRLKPSEFDHEIPPNRYVSSIMEGEGVKVADITRKLEWLLNRPVMDETHLDGRFDYELQYADKDYATLAAAIAEQLGLELVPAKREVELVVIRRAKPQ